MVRRVRYGAWSPLLLLVCAGSAIALAATVIPDDMERYWLAPAGAWTLAHGRVLETLQGSWFPERRWVDQEWLVAVATAWARAHDTYVMLELLFAACLVFGLCFVASETIRTRTHPLIACGQVAVTAVSAVFFAQDRAQTLVWALLPLTILAWRRRPWLSVPLLALWANVHGSFPIPLLWMILHLDRRRVAPLVFAALATLANPVGWRLWAFTFVLASNAKLGSYVVEWTPALATYTGIVVTLLALAPLWMRLVAGIRLREPVRYGDLIFVAATAIGTILAVRYAMLLFLTTATCLGEAFRTRAKPMPLATRIAPIFFTVMLLALALRKFLTVPVLADPWFSNVERGVGFESCAPLVRAKRVFTDALEVGSLVEMAGGSANVDGRIDAFPLPAIRDSTFVLNHPKKAGPIVRRSGAQALALSGAFQPPKAAWTFERRCLAIRVYGMRSIRTSRAAVRRPPRGR